MDVFSNPIISDPMLFAMSDNHIIFEGLAIIYCSVFLMLKLVNNCSTITIL